MISIASVCTSIFVYKMQQQHESNLLKNDNNPHATLTTSERLPNLRRDFHDKNVHTLFMSFSHAARTHAYLTRSLCIM